jgi:hypothetical protein
MRINWADIYEKITGDVLSSPGTGEYKVFNVVTNVLIVDLVGHMGSVDRSKPLLQLAACLRQAQIVLLQLIPIRYG